VTPRLYLDEDFMSEAVLQSLRARTIDVVTARDAGLIRASDDEQLDHAISLQRVLCTFNVRDFNRIHRERISTGRHHHGVIVARQQEYGAGEIVRRLLKLIAAHSAQAMRDRIEFLSAWG